MINNSMKLILILFTVQLCVLGRLAFYNTADHQLNIALKSETMDYINVHSPNSNLVSCTLSTFGENNNKVANYNNTRTCRFNVNNLCETRVYIISVHSENKDAIIVVDHNSRSCDNHFGVTSYMITAVIASGFVLFLTWLWVMQEAL